MAKVIAQSTSHGGTGFWWLLLPIPVLLVIILLLPPIGTYGEGILPELLGTHLLDTEAYAKFAVDARVWGGAILLISCLIGILLWYAQLQGWNSRLRELKAERVQKYRTSVLKHMLLACLISVILGACIALLSSSMRGTPVVSWIVLLVICAALSMIQYYLALLGIKSTRRLYLGRYL